MIQPGYRSSWPAVAKEPLSEAAREDLRRKAWQQQGIVHCAPDDLPEELGWLRDALTAWANQRYGARQCGKTG